MLILSWWELEELVLSKGRSLEVSVIMFSTIQQFQQPSFLLHEVTRTFGGRPWDQCRSTGVKSLNFILTLLYTTHFLTAVYTHLKHVGILPLGIKNIPIMRKEPSKTLILFYFLLSSFPSCLRYLFPLWINSFTSCAWGT